MRFQAKKLSLQFFLSASVLSAVTLSGCSSSIELASGWANQELRITGNEAQWNDATTGISGPDVRVGIRNDKNYLYVCLITANSATQLQILALGCTAWFDAEGTKSKTFGIQFPVSGLLQGRRFPSRENTEEIQRLVNAAQRQLEIRGPGPGDRRRIAEADGKGIEVHLGYVNSTLTYELKVPLQKSTEHPYAVNAEVSKPLSIGFETGDFAEVMRSQPASSNRLEVSPGRGRSGGRSDGGSGMRVGTDAPEQLKHWVTVTLATGQTAK